MNKKLICLLLTLVMTMGLAIGVQAAETVNHIQLTENKDGLEIQTDTVLDLNGFDATNVTVAQGVKLQLIDSANDEYKAEQCGSLSGTILGTVEQVVTYKDKDYLVIEENGEYSAHRFYAGIQSISLVPGTAALGYKAFFYADEVIKPLVQSYGYTMWVNSYKARTYAETGAITDHELTLRVKNILNEENTVFSSESAVITPSMAP